LAALKTIVDEQSLVAATRENPARFADLYELHFERVYAFIARRASSRQEAEDLTSEVFQQALANIKKFEWRGVPFAAWLMRIAANALADRWRRQARERGKPAPEEEVVENEPTKHTENRALLYRLVRALPEDQRRVIQMRFAEEKSVREIARALGRSEGAVRQLQFRALAKMRGELGAKPGERDG
jgi:RNA polymerase sigma-70 factor (ECF subfamily)